MEHTLNVVESAQSLATASLCSCGKMIGLITHEAIHAADWGFYTRHQRRVFELWERHRKQPRPSNPVECTILLQGGPRDGQKVTIPYHIYKGGNLIVMPYIPWQELDDEPMKTIDPVTYRREPGNPLIWSA